MSLPTRTLTVTTICCEDGLDEEGMEHKPPQYRLKALIGVPRQSYKRTCPLCGSIWRIERQTMKEGNGIDIDLMTWSPLRERLGTGEFRYNHQYT